MQKLLLKSLYVVARLKYPKLPHDLWYFVRDNYYCKLVQGRYVVRDFVLKKKYKVISYHGEFDQELRYVLPFAYWHHLKWTLLKTISTRQTKAFYFFSEDHEERFEKACLTESYAHYDVPNMTHSNTYSFRKWRRYRIKRILKMTFSSSTSRFWSLPTSTISSGPAPHQLPGYPHP